jgi:hypothetical protein
LTNLQDLINEGDPMLEPARDQPAVLDGTTEVVLQAALRRVGIIRIGDGLPQVVLLSRLAVDAQRLKWMHLLDPVGAQLAHHHAKRHRERAEGAQGKQAKPV